MSTGAEQREALEEMIGRLEAAKSNLDAADSDANFTNARVNGYIRTAQTALRAALSVARREREEL